MTQPHPSPITTYTDGSAAHAAALLVHFVRFAHEDRGGLPMVRRHLFYLNGLLAKWVAPPPSPLPSLGDGGSGSGGGGGGGGQDTREAFEAALFAEAGGGGGEGEAMEEDGEPPPPGSEAPIKVRACWIWC